MVNYSCVGIVELPGMRSKRKRGNFIGEMSKEKVPWILNAYSEKKKEIWFSPMTKAPTPTDKSKKKRDNTKNATKNFDYTTIADRPRTVSRSNNRNQSCEECEASENYKMKNVLHSWIRTEKLLKKSYIKILVKADLSSYKPPPYLFLY